MHHQERPTIINDLAKALDARITPITGDTQAVATIINRITTNKKKLKPWIPPKFCMYPNSPRTDELSFNKGLGQISLQPAIDSLNHFKQAAIMAIKAQFNAMGPEGSKDSKLAKGAADFLKQILEAAKCFTAIVQNVNSLIDTYIQVIDKLVVEVIQTIDRLESETMRLVRSLCSMSDLKTVITEELFDALDRATNIYEIIGLVAQIQQQVQKAALATDTLLHSKERVLLHLQVSLTLLQNRINTLLRYSALRDMLGSHRKNASNMYMTDDFLNDIDFSEVQASSFNWSVTNTAGLYEYNLTDELNIIPKLNNLFANYNDKLSAGLIIAAREEQGYIFVPELEESIISAGLDAAIGGSVSLILELSINNGDTIIRSIAKGFAPREGEKIIRRNKGVYFSKSKEKIEYNKVIARETNTWEIYLTETTLTPPALNDLYYFKDPSTQATWDFTITETTSNGKIINHTFPALWKVINVTHNSVTLLKMDSSNLNPSDFLENYNSTSSYKIVNTNSIPGVITPTPGLDTNSGQIRIFAKVKNVKNNNYDYFVCDPVTGTAIPKGSSYQTVNDFKVGRTGVPDNPINDDAAALWHWDESYIDKTTGLSATRTYTLAQTVQYSITLNKYVLPIGFESDSPHAGDKIPCLNWSLSVYVAGDPNEVNKVRFSRDFIAQPIRSFFLKAHWGFIPHTFTTAKSIDAQNKLKDKPNTKYIFNS
jgi:hypothetical protein